MGMKGNAKLGLLTAVMLILGLLIFASPTVNFWPWHSIIVHHDRAWLIKTAIFIGADPNAPFTQHHDLLPVGDRLLTYGITPLHVAAFYNSSVAIVTLIESGADPNASFAEYYHHTPLHTAASRTNANEAVAVLLEYGANPNARASNGLTPLHGAAMTNSVQIAQMLVQWGADPCIQHGGFLPAETARQWGSEETEELLLTLGAVCKE